MRHISKRFFTVLCLLALTGCSNTNLQSSDAALEVASVNWLSSLYANDRDLIWAMTSQALKNITTNPTMTKYWLGKKSSPDQNVLIEAPKQEDKKSSQEATFSSFSDGEWKLIEKR